MYHVEGLGQRIHWYRREKGLTQQQFADVLGVTPQAVSKWETNQGYPDLTLLPKVAETLGVRIDQLFGRATEEETPGETTRRELPDSLGDADLVCIHGDYALYSNVPVKRFAARNVLFADNSEAFLEETSVTNRGSGIIRFVPIQMAMDYGSVEVKENEPTLAETEGLEKDFVTNESSEPERTVTPELLVETDEPTFNPEFDVETLRGTQPEVEESRETIEGSEDPDKPAALEDLPAAMEPIEEFIHDHRSEATQQNAATGNDEVRILRMNVPGRADVNVHSNPDLDAPFAWRYNGEGEPTFEFADGDLRITMPSAFNTKNFMSLIGGLLETAKLDLAIRSSRLEHCGVRVSGVGDLEVDIPIDHLSLELTGAGDASFSHVGSVKGSLSGAGDLDIESAGDTEVEIRGAGDIEIKNIDGNLKFTLQGAGDVKIGSGYAPTAEITISGAGDVNASRVTVGDLYCNITGPGDVTIGRVTGKSQERVEFLGDLKILERGPRDDEV